MIHWRLQFWIRSLLACMAVVAMLLAAGIRFGEHIAWLVNRSRLPTLQAIPATPLVVEPVAEKFTSCTIGPMTLELPASICQRFDVQRSPGISLRFTDGTRTALINLTPMRDWVGFQATGFPDKANQTHLRLYREIAGVRSSDFSLGMTTEQLRWHKWLVTNRQFVPHAESIEYVETAGLEANLIRFSSVGYNYEWGTTDGKWKGTVMFLDPTGDSDWIRYAASTFSLCGDPRVLLNATDAELKKLVALSQANAHPEN